MEVAQLLVTAIVPIALLNSFAVQIGTQRAESTWRAGRTERRQAEKSDTWDGMDGTDRTNEGLPRAVELAGAENFRGLGGNATTAGHVRFGEVLRSGRLPIDSPTATELADRARAALSTGDFSSIPPELNERTHRLLIAEGSERYGELLRLIADRGSRPLVFHCSHGVHRTGTAAAILLSALGVDWPTIRSDYLAGNRL
jgi:hypothetical protein